MSARSALEEARNVRGRDLAEAEGLFERIRTMEDAKDGVRAEASVELAVLAMCRGELLLAVSFADSALRDPDASDWARATGGVAINVAREPSAPDLDIVQLVASSQQCEILGELYLAGVGWHTAGHVSASSGHHQGAVMAYERAWSLLVRSGAFQAGARASIALAATFETLQKHDAAKSVLELCLRQLEDGPPSQGSTALSRKIRCKIENPDYEIRPGYR